MKYFSFSEQKKVNKLINTMTRSSAVFTFDSIVGDSEPIMNVKQMAMSISNSFSNILILGESGTGKELFAQSVHNASQRRDYPFIALNCSSIPKNLIESELFGYDNGAFTGSKKTGQPGKFELANNGTLFLDEIGDMPMELQSSLLRVLQTHEVTRLGGTKPISLDVRIIAATNHDLNQAIKNNTFRKDLYYRLNVLNLMLPPLRKRRDDIPALIHFFMDRFSQALGKGNCTISDEAMQILCEYDWPGNVRELENIIERAVNILSGKEITVDHISSDIINAVRSTPLSGEGNVHARQNGVYDQEDHSIREILSPEIRERDTIIDLLRQENGHVASVASHMDIPASTLYRKMKKYQIRSKDYKIW